jgi:transcriptional regulator with XRE-family HTH domain
MRYAEQLRAGRALLDWSQDTLAERSDVGIATVRRLEGQRGILRGSIRSVWALQGALEQGGVIFLTETDGLGPGVRLARPPDAD